MTQADYPDPDLKLSWGNHALAKQRPVRCFAGFSVERMEGFGGTPVNFSRAGSSHYISHHDIMLADGEMFLDDRAIEQERNLRDTVTLLPSGSRIEGWSLPAERINIFTALYFEPSLLREDLETRYKAAPLRPVLYARDSDLLQTMRKLAAVFADPLLDDIYAESACLMAAIEALTLLPPEFEGSLTARQRQAVMEYVQEHLTDEISLSDLAAVAGLSRFHFGRSFKTTMGVSPYAFVLARRLERAIELLPDQAYSITDVARLSGFRSTANLRRKFLEAKGVTPAEFRRQVK